LVDLVDLAATVDSEDLAAKAAMVDLVDLAATVDSED
jgi:hypothetical protein